MAATTVVCGVILWATPLGQAWVNASYDYLFLFETPRPAKDLVVVLMDNQARYHLEQDAGRPWDRRLHAKFLNQLADDNCAMVVFDVFFRTNSLDPGADLALEEAMRRQRTIVLAASQHRPSHPGIDAVEIVVPRSELLQAAGTNHWGVAWLDPDLDGIVRRHWPFPAASRPASLPRVAARLAGAGLRDEGRRQWLRYYGTDGAWTTLGYRYALDKPAGYFEGKTVFIGQKPLTPSPIDHEDDEWRTPYTRWTGESHGGVEILATQYLNLMNDDWLRRPHWSVELLAILFFGAALGTGLSGFRLWIGATAAVATGLLVALGAIWLGHTGNVWIPWLVVAGGQVPCAVLCALVAAGRPAGARETSITMESPRRAAPTTVSPDRPTRTAEQPEGEPQIQDYALIKIIGQGAYGRVWLARNAIGNYCAVKAVYRSNFESEKPFAREFRGLKKYAPISLSHPCLLHVLHVGIRETEGYFYYVMEPADDVDAGPRIEGESYRPKTLSEELRQRHWLPVEECVRLGITLAGALKHLHVQGELIHRDIKPSNIIYVSGLPKLADIGLVTSIGPPKTDVSYVGTRGYMPPEGPGTVGADIFSLGKVLYEASMGLDRTRYPDLPSTLLDRPNRKELMQLNDIIIKACENDPGRRYQAVANLEDDLRRLQGQVENRRP